MLDALAGLDRSGATTALALAADRLLAEYYPTSPREVPEAQLQIADRVIGELRTRINRRPDEEEAEHLRRIGDALSREMSNAVLSGINLADIRTRTGQKGTLPTSLYDIEFTSYFRNQEPLLAMKRSYVLDSIQHADSIQHLRPKLLRSGLHVSLFTKSPRIHGRPYTILVKCNRIGANLQVDHALYLFHDSFNLSGAYTPLDMLMLFLDRFGLPIIIEGKPIDVLVEHLVKMPESGTLRFTDAGNQTITLNGQPGEETEIILMYSFDQVPYAEYLKKHGISSRPVGRTASFTQAVSFA
jgi:hypothetical protein